VPRGDDERDSDRASFTAFVAARQHALLRSAYLITGDRRLAEDLLQDALFKVAARWPRLRDGEPEAYARRILYRDSVSWWRRHRREEVRDPDWLRAAADARATRSRAGQDDVASRLVLDEALGRLTVKQRAVLVLRFYEDRSERETADLLGVTVGTVKSQTSAALARLRATAPELAGLLTTGEGDD
jgi:RNA polymerase sigma-70 factor (sigma-E family)